MTQDLPIIDQIDCNILRELQREARLSQRDIAERVGLSQNACWRRIRALDEAGLILRRTVVLIGRGSALGWW